MRLRGCCVLRRGRALAGRRSSGTAALVDPLGVARADFNRVLPMAWSRPATDRQHVRRPAEPSLELLSSDALSGGEVVVQRPEAAA